jgi:hypothetical protein
MLSETDAYRLAASARALNEAADTYASLHLKAAATELSDAAASLRALKLSEKAAQLRAAADDVGRSGWLVEALVALGGVEGQFAE